LDDREIILKDINKFRKYYNYFSISKTLEETKNIFINNDISLETLNRYIVTSDYLKILDNHEFKQNYIDLQSGINLRVNKYNNILIDLKDQSTPLTFIKDYPISLLFNFHIIDNMPQEYITNNELLELDNTSSIT
jgi:hypothetical protein